MMGREITDNSRFKFKAWDEARKKMFTPYQIAFQKKEGLVIRELVKGNLVKRPKSILIQFTGREDKNGKEIFDGDVLLYRKKEYSRVVQWDKESAKFKIGSADMYNCHLMEIIGNKYENPELLEDK